MRKSIALAHSVGQGFVSDGTGCQYPSHVATQCPHCGYASLFKWSNNQTNKAAGVSSGSSVCAQCRKVVRFVALFSEAEAGKFQGRPQEIRMAPAPVASYEMPDLPLSVPEPLRESLHDTIRAFNAQIYGAAATSGRRTLEGIFKYMLPEKERNQKLFELIRAAEDRIDFKEPLTRLADAIRSGGNLGAHFDEAKKPEVEMARQMVELLNYLIEYLYVLPEQIKELERSIESEQDSSN